MNTVATLLISHKDRRYYLPSAQYTHLHRALSDPEQGCVHLRLPAILQTQAVESRNGLLRMPPNSSFPVSAGGSVVQSNAMFQRAGARPRPTPLAKEITGKGVLHS